MAYNPGAFNRGAIASAIAGNRAQFDTTVLQYQQIENWAGRGNNAENRITIPEQSGISIGYLNGPIPNADNMSRIITTPGLNPPSNQTLLQAVGLQPTAGPLAKPDGATFDPSTSRVIQSNTSNLVTCPNAEGEVPLSCWLFSNENDTFARKNLINDSTPGIPDPPEIYVGPGNWLEMQNNGTGESSWATVTDDLYNAEQLPSEQRIFTGVMVNSNTGEMYETYEDDVPPPNTDRHRLLPSQMTTQNPMLTRLSGGHDPSMPARNKVEVPETELEADAGRNIWGSQLYSTAIRDIAEQIDVRQQYNNRDGFVPVEPAWDRRAVGFVGHVSAYRLHPNIPATQREAYGSNYTFEQGLRNVKTGNMDIPVDRNEEDYMSLSHRVKNRGYASADGQGASLAEVHLAPGRVAFSVAEGDAESRSTPGSNQLYSTGLARLREEYRHADYAQPQTANDLAIVSKAYAEAHRNDSAVHERANAAETFDLLNQSRLTTAQRGLQKAQSLGVGNLHQFSPTALSGISDGAWTYINDPLFMNSIKLVTDRTEQIAADVGIRHADAVANAADGRMADQQRFMDSVRLVTDDTRRNLNISHRNQDILNVNEQPGRQTAVRVIPEPVSRERAQGIGGIMQDTGELQRVFERASESYDRTAVSQYDASANQLCDEGTSRRYAHMDPSHDMSTMYQEPEATDRLNGGVYPSHFSGGLAGFSAMSDSQSRGQRGHSEVMRSPMLSSA